MGTGPTHAMEQCTSKSQQRLEPIMNSINRILNFFYKNVVATGVLWWFQIYNGWSGSLWVDPRLPLSPSHYTFPQCIWLHLCPFLELDLDTRTGCWYRPIRSLPWCAIHAHINSAYLTGGQTHDIWWTFQSFIITAAEAPGLVSDLSLSICLMDLFK